GAGSKCRGAWIAACPPGLAAPACSGVSAAGGRPLHSGPARSQGVNEIGLEPRRHDPPPDCGADVVERMRSAVAMALVNAYRRKRAQDKEEETRAERPSS